MKKKTNFLICLFVIIGAFLMLVNACKKEKVSKSQSQSIVKIPVLITEKISSITQTTASCGGDISSNGGAKVTARGVCWSTTQNPTISDSKTTDDMGTGSFTSSLKGLITNTTYYVRAYAINYKGVAYGNEKSFKTPISSTATTPILTIFKKIIGVIKYSIIDITKTSASSGGNISSNGGADVTARGVCWSTTQNPTVSDSKTTDGTGTGSFTSSLTNLTDNTTYYVRAYATNSIGTAYSSEVSFTTQYYDDDLTGKEQTIAELINPGNSDVADLDGDGDMDILSSSSNSIDDKIVWYKNDGHGNFGKQKIISFRTEEDPISVYAADLDDDGDMDVFTASTIDNKIAWYKNDGHGNFSTQKIITTNAKYAHSVCVADIDGDGNKDVLSASLTDNKIAWYKNDGAGNFGDQKIITTNIKKPSSVHAADINNDGATDVFVTSVSSKIIAWYKNDGTGNFTQKIISSDLLDANELTVADLDGDGEKDILVAIFDGNKIIWYKNNGAGNFSDEKIISTNKTDGAIALSAADFDRDGDMDVFSASRNDNKIAWYENKGGGEFAEQRVISTNVSVAIDVELADLDGDGKVDVMAVSNNGAIYWYKNKTK
jgi:hypothetical protein